MPFAHHSARKSDRSHPPVRDTEPDVPAGAVPGAALLEGGYDFSRIPVHAEREADRVAEEVTDAAGSSSPRDVMQSRFGVDLSAVRVHTGAAAADAAAAAGARAYTLGRDIVFGADEFNPGTVAGNRLFAHELAHVVQQANGSPPVIARKEVHSDGERHGERDWTTADRVQDTPRWRAACLANLNSGDSSQYVRIVERRDFYKWFFNYAAERGFDTRWALAASVVAEGAHQIADMDTRHDDANNLFGMAGVELQGAMRQGNQVIFDNVLPKLKALVDGGKLTGTAALNWDMQTLAEEQNLVQPMYKDMSAATVEQLDYIARKKALVTIGTAIDARTNPDEVGDEVKPGTFNKGGTVPKFDEKNIRDVGDRWMYGMKLGNEFMATGTRFDPAANALPSVGAGYRDGSEFARVNTRAHLHELDAWLNPNRISRTGSGSNIETIINGLSPAEKQLVLADHSPDGWSYSIQFAQFGLITAAMVARALPTTDSPETAAAVAAFLTRYRVEREQVKSRNPTQAFALVP